MFNLDREAMKLNLDFIEEVNRDPGLFDKSTTYWDTEFVTIRDKDIPEIDKQEQYASLMPKIPSLVAFSTRLSYISSNSWAVPTREAISAIKGFVDDAGVLSIGSGLALWEKLLLEQGVDIIASDVNISGCIPPSTFMDKSKVTAPVVPKVPSDRYWNMKHKAAISKFLPLYQNKSKVLFICWPSYTSNHAYESVQLLNPDKIVYIGEGEGYSCANDNFFNILGEKYNLTRTLNIPQWYGIYDAVHLFQKKT